MYRKILAALGHAPSRRIVFEQALAPAIQDKAKLLLVHVLNGEDVVPIKPAPSHDFFAGQSAYGSYWLSHETARRKAAEWLETFVQEAKDAGVDAQYAIHDMSPERVLQMQATNWEADLIVVGDHGISNTSISNYMCDNAPCTVLVLPMGLASGQQDSAAKPTLQCSMH
jgi:nucleotide-binding universal stress UspA family protein